MHRIEITYNDQYESTALAVAQALNRSGQPVDVHLVYVDQPLDCLNVRGAPSDLTDDQIWELAHIASTAADWHHIFTRRPNATFEP